MKKAVIFDLDGTILDTIKDIAAAVNRALVHFGHPKRTVAEVQSYLGNGSLMLIKRALPEERDDEYCIQVRARFRREYDSDMYSNTVPYEGIAELLKELKDKGVKTAVVTNKDHKNACPMIEHYFGDLFDVCAGVTGDGDRKPNPEKTLSVLKEWGITPEEALFVGDGRPDYQVSVNSGIDFVPVGYGYTSSETLFSLCGKEASADVDALRRELLQYF